MKRRLLILAAVTAAETVALALSLWLTGRHISRLSDLIEEAYS